MTLPILTGTAVRGFVGALVAGILASTFVPLGVTFTIVGPATLGIALLALGLGFAATAPVLALLGRRRDARERDARTERTTAIVLEATLDQHSRVGVRHPLRLAVNIAGARAARTLFVPSWIGYTPGTAIQVAFAPNNPDNFLPLE
ncbi:hypothetical protein DVA67_021155 [Solirubrobacter sp. CPCC 204708]|uniref:DUF58 domain-containing protein n=1 Tax=Solirubrobacter deserti TaxID=2282478 RepID=A0ABT4REK1_9ACTN|nr:hypothetical protein [Solirubrobacter deserti]MBE2318503.1 hypothetical protein [Solirubrobacter deserti]MDA0136961.1 hypothetical protein [Solirubrobacter deserti]